MNYGLVIAFIISVCIIAAVLRLNSKKCFEKAKKENEQYNRELQTYLFGDKEN